MYTLEEQERAAYQAGDITLAEALAALADARELLGEARALLCDPDGDAFAADKLLARIEEALA
jgi:hypothetical protein